MDIWGEYALFRPRGNIEPPCRIYTITHVIMEYPFMLNYFLLVLLSIQTCVSCFIEMLALMLVHVLVLGQVF